MTYSPPQVILDLTILRAHFRDIIDRFPSATLCFTDGCKQRNRLGYAFSINNPVYLYRHRNSSSIYTAKLQAIFHCLECILHRAPPTPTQNYLFVSESFASPHSSPGHVYHQSPCSTYSHPTHHLFPGFPKRIFHLGTRKHG